MISLKMHFHSMQIYCVTNRKNINNNNNNTLPDGEAEFATERKIEYTSLILSMQT